MRTKTIFMALGLFLLGFCIGLEARKNDEVDPSLFRGQTAERAAANLLEVAMNQAGKGSWERIAVARLHYLSGDKERAQEVFDSIRKKDASDWIRIGRVHWQAGDWAEAKAAFEKVIAMKPKDEDWLAEIGAYYNLEGERAKAEELFERSFREDADNLYNTLSAAGSYIGLEER